MKKGDVAYISSTSGVEEGVVTVAKSWPNVRVDGTVRKGLSPDIIHATRDEAETAVLAERASAAMAVVRSRRYDASGARSALDQARFVLARTEADVVRKEAAEAEAVALLGDALNVLAARELGDGVRLRPLGSEPVPAGAGLVVLHYGRLRIVATPNWSGETYIVVRP